MSDPLRTSSASFIFATQWILLASFLFTLPKTLDAGACTSGRYYLGNVNTTHPHHLQYTGVYTQVKGEVHEGRPVYKHLSRHLFIFTARTDMESHWIIAPNVTSNLSDVTIRLTSSSPEPMSTAETKWQLKEKGVWVSIPKLRTVCVSNKFGPCTSGKINVTGLPMTSRGQGRFMGTYFLQNVSQSLRPIYIKDGGPEVLFHGDNHGLWVFSRSNGSKSIDLFTKDGAFLPEFILDEWAYFNGFGLRSVKLRITCLDQVPMDAISVASRGTTLCPPESNPPEGRQQLSATPPEESDQDMSIGAFGTTTASQDSELASKNSRQMASVADCLQTRSCANGGTLVTTGTGEELKRHCRCVGGFYGVRCEKELRCGPAPSVSMATLDQILEEGPLTIAVYRCDSGYYSNNGLVAVCGLDDRWLYVPVCHSPLHSGYDWSEVSP